MANKNETAKKVVGGVALGLVLVLAGGVCGGLLQRHFNWGEDPAVETPAGETANGGAIIGESHGSGARLMSTKIAAADYEEYGVSPMAETAYTITATITPSNATNKAVDWSVAFVNASSSWASGKTVTDYVTITPTTDGALMATVECLQAFGEQVIITATSRGNTDISATATCDYVKRVDSLTAGFSANELKWNTEYTVTVTPVYGTGTLQGQLTVTSGDIALTEGFKDAIEAKMRPNYASTLTYYDPANFLFDTSSLKFQFDELNPFLTFAKSEADKATQMKVRDDFNNAFTEAAGDYAETQAVFTLGYTYVYGGETYNSGEDTVDLKFDTDDLVITVTNISFDEDSFIF